jgi:uncharacterized membrane-anchored protein YhcB (DUF1043 family)
MENKELEKLLETLHQELQKTESLDEKGAELLRGLDADIRNLLDHSEKSSASMLERWRESVQHFEVTHPALTALLSDLMSSLSNAGI